MAIASSSTDQPCPEKAAEYQKAIDERSDVDSMYKLASLLQRGSDTLPVDPHRAATLFRRAIDEGNHLPSMLSLASMAHSGYGDIKPDAVQAAQLYELAIEEHDDAVAMCKRALLTLEDVERTVEEEERALDYLQRSAEKGYANAMGELGLMHHVGWGSFSKDLGRAAALFKQAIEVGRITNSMYYLAWIVLDGYDDIPPDPNGAVLLLQQAIDEGNDTDAMVFLAKILRDGQGGVKKDWNRAAELLQRAEGAGHSSALYHLACLYINARDEDEWRKDLKKAVELLSKSIAQFDDKHAMFKLALIYKDGYEDSPPNVQRAVELLKRAVEEGGHIHAMLELAMILRKGAEGVERNDEEADALLRTVDARIQVSPHDIDMTAANMLVYAAEHGDSFAEMLLGIHYKFGDEPFGLDKSKALRMLRGAAEAGNSEAMFHLGMMLMDGIGDEQPADMERAMDMFHKAADEHDNLAAINVLASFLLEGYRDVEADVRQAVKYLERAIDLGDTHSMNRLGMLYLEGYLLPDGRDVKRAIEMFSKAVEEEDVNACHNLAILHRNGHVTGQRNEEEAKVLLDNAIDKRRHFRSMVAMADLLLCSASADPSKRDEAAQLVEDAIEMGDLDAGNLHTALRNGGYDDDDDEEAEGGNREDDEDEEDDVDEESVDYSRRAGMFRLAVSHGDKPVAFYSLGCLVQESQADVCADPQAAARWFQRAIDCRKVSDKAHGLSAVALASLLTPQKDGCSEVNDMDVDVERARTVLGQAAQHGSVEAANMLKAM